MRFKKAFAIIFAVAYFLQASLCASANGFPTNEYTSSLTPEEQEILWKNISIEVSPQAIIGGPISSFDIGPDGQVALGFQSGDTATVAVYSEDGEFQYAYSFNCYGSMYVFWEQEDVGFYFVRGDSVVIVDVQGKPIFIGSEDDISLDLEWLKSSQKEIDGVQYRLENDLLLGDKYSRLCVVKGDGTQYLLYDVTAAHNTQVILAAIGVCAFFCLTAMLAAKQRNTKQAK